MIAALEAGEYARAKPLLNALEWHLAPLALIAGAAPGRLWVDDPAAPASALAQLGYRFYLTGRADNAPFNEGVRRLFTDEIYPQAAGRGELSIYYADDAWADVIGQMLRDKYPMPSRRRYLEARAPRADWLPLLPAGLTLHAVDAALLRRTDLSNLDDLRAEMMSETPAVEFFLATRFGVCLAAAGELAGWCLSEYNCGDRCEVGIETVRAYRRRGVGTALAGALLAEAKARGISRVGWHSYADNVASVATARKAGFADLGAYPVYFTWFDEVANLAVNGNLHFRQGDYRTALPWFERAFAAGDAPAWAYLHAAAAQGALGETTAALAHLHQAVERGFRDAAYVRSLPQLAQLHGAPEWQAILAALEAEDR